MSPVYERTFPDWEGTRTPAWRRVAAIAARELDRALSSTWVWVLWVATLLHVGYRGLLLYFSGRVGEAGQGGPGDFLVSSLTSTLSDTLALQGYVLLFALAVVAAGALARDLDAGALTFYFSKPITRTGYALGKLATPVLVGLSVTVGPLLVVWLLGVAFLPDVLLPNSAGLLLLRAVGAGALVTLAASLVAVGISALTRSTNVAAGSWVALVLVTRAFSGALARLAGDPRVDFVDVFHAFNVAADNVLGAAGGRTDVGLGWLVTLGWALAATVAIGAVLHREEVAG